MISTDITSVDLNDGKTWDLICSGRTKGVFQLDSNYSAKWAERIKPRNIDELAAVISVIRPGCRDAIVDGKSMTDRYADRKNGLEEVTFLHPALEDVLRPTYAILVFQEQALRIAQKVAGFTLKEAEVLRKSIGKKIVSLMNEMHATFIDGCLKTGLVDKDIAEMIFDNIKASQRYSFNKCLSKDTIIRRYSTGGKIKGDGYTVEHMYKVKNDPEYAKRNGHAELRRKWISLGSYGEGLSLCEDGRIKPNIIRNIYYSGYRPVWKITTESGHSVIATENHKFPTDSGIKEVSNLNIGDNLYIRCDYEKFTDTKRYNFSNLSLHDLRQRNSEHDSKTLGFMSGNKNPGYTNGGFTNFIRIKNTTPNNCKKCGATNIRLEMHHKDKNRTNNDDSNLEKLCVSCHKKEDYKLGRIKKGQKGYPSTLSKIVSIEYKGFEDVYDVEMDGPNHNLVVNDRIVTCNSHAVAYAMETYRTSYIKANYTPQYFTSWLQYAQDKEEIEDLVVDAKEFGVKVEPPSILKVGDGSFHLEDNIIYYGIGRIRDIGESQTPILIQSIKDVCTTSNKTAEELSWMELLTNVLDKVNSKVATNLIKSGCLSNLKRSRKELLFEYQQWRKLKAPEKEFIRGEKFDDLKSGLTSLLEKGIHSRRVETVSEILRVLKSPPYSLEDTVLDCVEDEEELLGISITLSRLDGKSLMPTVTCREFVAGRGDKKQIIAVEIKRIKEYITNKGASKGSPMAFVTVEDESGRMDVTLFADVYAKYKDVVIINNVVHMIGDRSKKGGLTVNKVFLA